MSYAEILRQALGPPERATPVSPDVIRTLDGTVPEALIELWRSDGWAGYGNGLFWTTDPRHLADVVPRWTLAPPGAQVIGRDAFANLYLLSTRGVHLLNVHVNTRDKVAPDLDLLFRACLDDVEFRESYMWSATFTAALDRCGPLEHDECYGFFPALALGGSFDDASLIQRVKYYEHLEFLAQLHE